MHPSAIKHYRAQSHSNVLPDPWPQRQDRAILSLQSAGEMLPSRVGFGTGSSLSRFSILAKALKIRKRGKTLKNVFFKEFSVDV